jgi:hypothetical protein
MNELEAKRKAEAAPDREKFLALAYQLEHMALPECSNESARIAVSHLKECNQGAAAWLRKKAGEL